MLPYLLSRELIENWRMPLEKSFGTWELMLFATGFVSEGPHTADERPRRAADHSNASGLERGR